MKIYSEFNLISSKKYCFIALSIFFVNFSMSQYSTGQSDFWKQVRYGGGIGLDIFNGGFNASISPSAIYPVSNTFSAGVSLNVNYAKFDDSKLLAYGGSILSLYNPIPQIQLSGELEQLRINSKFQGVAETINENYWSPALFLGIGFTNRNVTVGVRYNILYDGGNSIYADGLLPFVRFYF